MLMEKKKKGMYSMKFTFAHNNLNVLDLDKSLAFYKKLWI